MHTPTTGIYPLSLHDALPIYVVSPRSHGVPGQPSFTRIPAPLRRGRTALRPRRAGAAGAGARGGDRGRRGRVLDRKSTRLNSSHLVISYAVFCLKKKTT